MCLDPPQKELDGGFICRALRQLCYSLGLTCVHGRLFAVLHYFCLEANTHSSIILVHSIK